MEISVTNRGGEITPDLQEHLDKKLRKLERISGVISEMHVVIVYERPDRRVEVSAHAYGQDLFAEERGEDLPTCIDVALERLVKQVKKRKGRVTDHTPHPH
ncbi:MAG TPA: ribosome-associated translation inhibitor RaiA [bacterium]|nr:ribosome-associated translation inhibitor RaiA [bacterium]HQP97876.1 ribosome-associated translation inhibitor RaiA [bacterium]